MNPFAIWQKANAQLPLTAWERVLRRFVKHALLFNLLPLVVWLAQVVSQLAHAGQLNLPVGWIAIITSVCAGISTIDKAVGAKKDAVWGAALGVIQTTLTQFLKGGIVGKLLGHIVNPADAPALANLLENALTAYIQQQDVALKAANTPNAPAPTAPVGQVIPLPNNGQSNVNMAASAPVQLSIVPAPAQQAANSPAPDPRLAAAG